MKSVTEKDGEKKKVVLILIVACGLLGIVLYWLLGPILFQGQDKMSKDEINKMYADLDSGNKATESEENYLEGANQPTELSMDADEGSLSLIKREPKALDGKKKDDSIYTQTPSKVSSYGSATSKMREKLSRMMGINSGGGSRSGGDYKGADLDKWSKRFGKDSGFKGGNVATGPSATKFGGKGTRQMPDSKADQLASAMGKKFGEGGSMGRAVDPKSAADVAARGVPSDLKDQVGKINKPEAPQHETPANGQKDPCKGIQPVGSGSAWLEIAAGVATIAVGAMIGSGATGATATTGPSFMNTLGSAFVQPGAGLMQHGITDVLDPQAAMRQCRGGGSGAQFSAGGAGGK